MTQQTIYPPPILDIEASGFGRGSYPIEIGYALADGQVQTFLVKPQADWRHWSAEAFALHGLSREKLMTEGLPARQVAEALNDALRGKTLYSDAWGFDVSWLGKLFESAGLMPRFRLDALNSLLTEEEMQDWWQCKEQVAKKLALPRHRAANDIRLLQQSFVAIKTPVAS